MVVPSNVKLIKFPVFDEADQVLFDAALAHFFNKVGPRANLVLSLKEYRKGGLRAQHEVHGKLVINGVDFFAERKGWLLLGVVQEVLKVLERELKKMDSIKK